MSTTAMISNTPLRQIKDVRELLSNNNARSQLASVAAKHMNPERMMRVVANAIRTTPKLQEAEPLSMLGALMNCASLGLEPNTQLGHAYLVPFWNGRKKLTEVQVIIGYKGFIDLARRSGMLISIHADVVYSDDVHFSAEYGSNQHLRHIPGPRKGERLGAYCHIKVKNGDLVGEGHVYMPADEILAIRDRSQGWISAKRFGKTADSPWITSEDRMWAKTAVRRIANSGEMPMSIEFMQAMDVDDARVDYAAYAINPADGVMIDGDMVDDDGVVEEKAGAREVEKPKPAVTGDALKPDRAVAAEIEPGYDIDARPDETDGTTTSKAGAAAPKAEEKSDAAAASVDRAALVAIRDSIILDIKGVGSEPQMLDACRDYHAHSGGLQRLKREAPDLWEEIEAAFRAAANPEQEADNA
ncbi:MAG: recombinase RecT [Hyphomonadaceae bacterium]|nr:recombinase RecT [Hyphomonadaceae bacterium]